MKPTIAKTDHELLVEIHEMLTALTARFREPITFQSPSKREWPIINAIGSDKCGADTESHKS